MVVIMYILLIYDVEVDGNGAKATRNIFKICKKYLSHVQKSVFEGEITPALLMQLKLELKKHIREERDSVIIFKSRDEKWLQKEFWGMVNERTSNFF